MTSILFKPFTRFSANSLLLVGIVVTLIGSYVGYLGGARFDGVLDIHFGESVLLQSPFLENIINVLMLSIFLFIGGKVINEKTRLIDIVVTSLVARIPYYLIPLLNVKSMISKATDQVLQAAENQTLDGIPNLSLVLLTVFSVVVILFAVWYVVLLFNGFKTASNAKGAKHVVFFAVSILLAEITSILIIHHLI